MAPPTTPFAPATNIEFNRQMAAYTRGETPAVMGPGEIQAAIDSPAPAPAPVPAPPAPGLSPAPAAPYLWVDDKPPAPDPVDPWDEVSPLSAAIYTPEFRVRTYKGPTGETVSAGLSPSLRSVASKEGRGKVAIGSTADVAALHRGDPELADVAEEVIEEHKPGTFESIVRTLDPLLTVQRLAWQAAAMVGHALLPELSEDQRVVLAQDVPRQLDDFVLDQTNQWVEKLDDDTVSTADKAVARQALLAADDGIRTEAAKRFYQAIADGTFQRRGETRRADIPFWFSEWRAPQISGTDVIDAIITKGEARAMWGASVALRDTTSIKRIGEMAEDLDAVGLLKTGWSLSRAIANGTSGDMTRIATLAPAEGYLYRTLSTDVGRELVGIMLEMVLDPLWLLGGAGGAKVISAGGKLIRAPTLVTKAMGSLARIKGTTAAVEMNLLGRVATGAASAEDAAKLASEIPEAVGRLSAAAQQASARAAELRRMAKAPEEAVTQAHRALDTAVERMSLLSRLVAEGGEAAKAIPDLSGALATATREVRQARGALAALAGRAGSLDSLRALGLRGLVSSTEAARAKVYLTRQASMFMTQANALRQQAGAMGRVARIMADGELAKHVTRAVGIPVHIPFTTRTYYPLRGAIDVVGAAAARATAPYDYRALRAAVQAAGGTTRDLSAGQRLYYQARELSVAKAGQAVFFEAPAFVYDIIGRHLFSRMHMPSFVRGLKGAFVHDDQAIVGSELVLNSWRRIKGVAKETWASYQQAWVNYLHTHNGLTQVMQADIQRMAAAADKIATARQRLARAGKAPAEFAEQWANKAYSADDVLHEAVYAWEGGGGRLQAGLLEGYSRPELLPLVERISAFAEGYAARVQKPLDEVRQVIQVLGRKAAGDPNLYEDIARAFAQMDDTIARSMRDKSIYGDTLDEAIQTWRGALGSMRAVLDAVDAPALAKAVERMEGAIKGKNLTQPDRVKLIRQALYGAVRDYRVGTNVDEKAARAIEDGLVAAFDIDPFHSDARAAALEAFYHYIIGSSSPGGDTARRVAVAINNVKWNLAQDIELADSLIRGGALTLADMPHIRRVVNAQTATRVSALLGAIGEEGWRFLNAWVDAPDKASKLAAQQNLLDHLKPLMPNGEVPPHALAGLKAKLMAIRRAAGAVSPKLADAHAGVGATRPDTVLQRMLEMSAQRLAVEAPTADLGFAVFARLAGFPEAAEAKAKVIAQLSAKDARIEAAFAAADAVRPKLVVPDMSGPGRVRNLEEWEGRLLGDLQGMVSHLSEEDGLLALMGVLRDVPELVRELPEGFAKLYGEAGAMGRRMFDVRPDLAPVVGEIRRIIRSYEGLYAAHGLDVAKDAVAMIRDWGNVEYFPHLMGAAEQLEAGRASVAREATAVAGRIATGAGVDHRFSLDLPAGKRRELARTIHELNAAANDSAATFTLDPQYIIARFASSNRAIGAKQFLSALVESGVARVFRSEDMTQAGSAAARAAAEDYVPLFKRPSKGRAWQILDLLMQGTADQWKAAGITGDELAAMRASLKPSARAGEASSFATWMFDLPELARTTAVEELLVGLRAANYKAGEALVDPVQMFLAERDVFLAAHPGLTAVRDETIWNRVAATMNTTAADLQAGLPRVSGKHLMTYFGNGKPLFELYVPAAVYQSMEDLTAISKLADAPVVRHLKRAVDATNAFWKARLTVINTAFSTRNLWNHFSNILDLGPFGALNPVTQYHSSRLAMASWYVDKFGSLDDAAAHFSRPWTEATASMNLAQKAEYATARETYFNAGIHDLQLHGVDIGDGVHRTGSELMAELIRRGIITPAYSNYTDIARWETSMSETMAKHGFAGLWGQARRRLSQAEDLAVVGGAMLIAGPLGATVVVPKKIGGMMAQFVENQARLCNFIGNVKRTQDWEQALNHTTRLLFNYDDLNAFQRVWMRTIIPFFTWTSKNLALQSKMMFEQPGLYAHIHQAMAFQIPDAIDAWNAKFEGRAPRKTTFHTQYDMQRRDQHTWTNYQIPVPYIPGLMDRPLKDAYFEGFGSPIEAASQLASQLSSLLSPEDWEQTLTSGSGRRPALRIAATMAIVPKLLAELLSQRNLYYDRPMDEMNNGQQIESIITSLERTQQHPVVGPVFGWAAAMMESAIKEMVGWHATSGYVDPQTGGIRTDMTVTPVGNHAFSNQPWRQMFKNAATTTSDTAFMLFYPETRQREKLDFWLRYLNAMTYIRVGQYPPGAQDARYWRDIEDETNDRLVRKGAIQEYDVSTAKK